MEVQPDLVAGGRTRRDQGRSDGRVDGSVQVAGHQEAHLGAPLDDGPKAIGVQEPGVVHEFQAGLEGWEVREHEGGPVRAGGQDVLQPAFP